MSETATDTQKQSWDYIKTVFPEYRCKNKHFASLIKPFLGKEKKLLDLGCGRGLETVTNYKESVGEAVGLDPTDAVFQNELIHKPVQGSAYEMPLEDNYFDIVVSQQVLEHIEHPEKLFSEVSRVLKPGGVFYAMTPNLWYPTTLFAAITPYWFHLWATKTFMGIEEHDTFPTHYQANRRSTLRKIGEACGFDVDHIELYQCNPGQFAFSPLLTKLEVWYIDRLVKNKFLTPFKDVVIGGFTKK